MPKVLCILTDNFEDLEAIGLRSNWTNCNFKKSKNRC